MRNAEIVEGKTHETTTGEPVSVCIEDSGSVADGEEQGRVVFVELELMRLSLSCGDVLSAVSFPRTQRR